MRKQSGVTGKTPMAGTPKTTIAMFGSAAALAFAIGFTGVGLSSPGSATAPTPDNTAERCAEARKGAQQDVHQ